MNTDYRPPHWSQFLGINFRRLALLLILGCILVFIGWRGYRHFAAQKRVRLVSAAQKFLKAGDSRSAVLSARQVLQEDPGNAAAVKVMAEAANQAGSPAALLWRARMVELEPNRLEHLLDWATTALWLKQFSAAEQALSQAAGLGKDSARYHELAAVLALAGRQVQKAEEEYAAAARLDPKDGRLQLNLANVRLQSPDTNVVKAARATLQQLAANEAQRVPALRASLADALRSRRHHEAIAFALSIVQSEQATFPDQIEYLTLLNTTKDAGLDNALQRLRERVAEKPGEVSQLAAWMRQHGLGREALAWIQSLPTKTRDTMPVPIATAECRVQLRQWTELTAWLSRQNWEELNFLRFAFLARAARESGLVDPHRLAWKQALSATQQEVQSLAMLARTADGWKWTAEAEQIWWMIAMGSGNQRPALAALNRLYTTRKNERMLLRVAARIYNLNSSDAVAKNNLAHLSLLLNENSEQAYVLARENFRQYPTSSAFRSTYAFALHRHGKTKEALDIYSEIPADKLQHPAMSAYYGILLAAAGRKEEAGRYLTMAEKSDGFLPSERRLIASARASLK